MCKENTTNNDMNNNSAYGRFRNREAAGQTATIFLQKWTDILSVPSGKW